MAETNTVENIIPDGFNIIIEVIFGDPVCWLARIPLPESCHQPEEITLSYAATLKYLKIHTTIPVPCVYDYAVKSEPKNATGVSYILMEYLPGCPLPELERSLEPSEKDRAITRKVHQQLTDLMLELATLKFDKIGSLREASDGGFFIAAFADTSTGDPKERASAYSKLAKEKQGPFSSISAFYEAMSDLNDVFVKEDAESEDEEEATDKELVASQYQQLRGMAPKFILADYQNGPFVINHNDLTGQNILVDDQFNITGGIDFPGTVVPLPSMCFLPWIFRDNTTGLLAVPELYLDVFLHRDALDMSSALAAKLYGRNSCRVRLNVKISSWG
ncbi:MAG: hypothetical protein M1826_002328 [Phylliscum demangeonii]|nr:MAG: hypothetical protein M1826_002328 [Phylliscum demangeonii]